MCEIMNRFNIGTRRRFLSEPIPVTIFTLWIFTLEFRYIFDGRIDFASLYLARTSSLNIFDKLVCPAFVHIESLGKLFPKKSFSTHLHLHKYCPFVWNIYILKIYFPKNILLNRLSQDGKDFKTEIVCMSHTNTMADLLSGPKEDFLLPQMKMFCREPKEDFLYL